MGQESQSDQLEEDCNKEDKIEAELGREQGTPLDKADVVNQQFEFDDEEKEIEVMKITVTDTEKIDLEDQCDEEKTYFSEGNENSEPQKKAERKEAFVPEYTGP